MSGSKIGFRKLIASAAAFAVGTYSMVAVAVTPSVADTAPPVTSPPTPVTVSADVLPTVQINGVVWSQVVVGNTVYAAGSFTSARPAGSPPGTNTVTRNNLLAYDIRTGALVTSFAPNLNGQALAVAASPDGTRLYVGGDFTNANGQTRSRIAAYDLTTNLLVTNFKPIAGTKVRAIVATNSTVYFGGDFVTVSGVSRPHVAAVSATTGALLNWNPNADAPIDAITITKDGSKVVLGGRFTHIGGNAWFGMAAVSSVTGLTVPWAATSLVRNAGVGAAILSLTATSDGVYGTGYVYNGTGNLEGAFRADAATGKIIWIEDCHGDSYSIYAGNPDVVYVASHAHYCGNIGGFPQTPLPWDTYRGTAFTKAVTGTITTDPYGYYNWAGNPRPSLLNWFPSFTTGSFTGQGQAGWSVTGNSQYIVYGGEFPDVNGVPQQGLVRFAVSGLAPNKIGPNANDQLTPTVALQSGGVKVSWLETFDRDNTNLTYKVYRNFKSLADTPIFTTTRSNTFWQRIGLSFVDTTAPPGRAANYRVYVLDPFNNAVTRGATTINVPASVAAAVTAPTVTVAEQSLAKAMLTDRPSLFWPLGDSLTSGQSNGFVTTVTAAPSPKTFTAEAWVKTKTTRGGQILGYGDAGTGDSAAHDRDVYMDNQGRILFGVNSGGIKTINSGAGFNDNQWHQIAASLGSKGMQLFVDGRLAASRTDVTTAQSFSGYWRAGGDNLSGWPNQPSSFDLAGATGYVAVYPAALTEAQINNHYRVGSAGAQNSGQVALAQDFFTRTVVSGLGSSDSGPSWTLSGGQSGFAVNSGAAHFTVSAGGSAPTASLDSVSSANTDVKVDVSVGQRPAGSGVVVALVGRSISSTDDYRANLKISPAGQVVLDTSKRVGGTETMLSTRVISGLTYTAGTTLTLRLRVAGAQTATLDARVWQTGTAEPTAWQSSASDSSTALHGAGGIGLGAHLVGGSGALPVVATFDNLIALPA